MKRLLTIIMLLSLGACGKRPMPAQMEPLLQGLKNALQAAKVQEPCASIVPGEWARSAPIPLADGSGHRRFKIFFYGVMGHPGIEAEVYAPGADAVLNIDLGRPDACEMRSPGPEKIPNWRRSEAQKSGLGVFPLADREGKFYDLTERVANIYIKGQEISPKEKSLAHRYLNEFRFFVQPDFLPEYYRMNPAFWEWLRLTAGESIPKS